MSLRLHRPLTELLSQLEVDEELGVPDFLLAGYLCQCLDAFRALQKSHEDFEGRGSLSPPTILSADQMVKRVDAHIREGCEKYTGQVSTNDLTDLEIVEARAEGVLQVDEDGLGFVSSNWLECTRAYRAMKGSAERHNTEKRRDKDCKYSAAPRDVDEGED